MNIIEASEKSGAFYYKLKPFPLLNSYLIRLRNKKDKYL